MREQQWVEVEIDLDGPSGAGPWLRRSHAAAVPWDALTEVLLPFPEPIVPLRHVRSTLLLGSFASLQAAGSFDEYAAVVPREVRETIQSSVAGMWLPIDLAVEHYLACDKLGISSESAARIGRSTFDRTKGLLLGTAIGLAKGVGVTPWTLAPHLQRFWLRGYDGGGVRAIKLGPKEMRVDVVSCPLFAGRYYRAAYRGLATGLLELVAQKAYAHEQRMGGSDSALSLRIQWV